MGLVPEFFVLLGISIFLAMSLLSHFLGDELPSRLHYMFQVAAGIGLGELIISQMLTDLTRFWVSAIYLAFALSGVLGLNIYLVVVRRNMAIAPAFSGAVTAPILMISGLFVYSFLGSAGEVGLALAAIVSLAILMSLTSLSIFGFLREVSKPTRSTHSRLGPAPTGPMLAPPRTPMTGLPLQVSSMKGEEWEESPKKPQGQE